MTGTPTCSPPPASARRRDGLSPVAGPRSANRRISPHCHRALAGGHQDAEHGALPVLYAAVADIPGDSFAGPSHLAHMRGAPELTGRSAAAQDPDLARRLWDVSQQLTGVRSAL
jgi:hypothetical protein